MAVQNRSVPDATVIPELPYDDVVGASEWLCDAFGLTVRLRIGAHRAQLRFGDGAVVAVERRDGQAGSCSVLVRVDGVDAHHDHAAAAGAHILRPPEDHPYGERQYTAEDIGGHRWTFSESVADVDPASWGATDVDIG